MNIKYVVCISWYSLVRSLPRVFSTHFFVKNKKQNKNHNFPSLDRSKSQQ